MQKILNLFKTHPYLEGKILDNLLILFTPLLALVLGSGLYNYLFHSQGELVANEYNLVMLIITQMHLVMVFARSYNNPEVFKRFKPILIAAPIIILGLLLAIEELFFIAIFVTMLLDPYHTGTQNYRIGREYDKKLQDNTLGKNLDHLLSLFIHLVPVIMMVSVDKMKILLNLGAASTDASSNLLTKVLSLLETIKPLTPIVFGLFLIIYVIQYRQMIKQGYQYSVHKALLFIISFIANLIAWAAFEPLVAVMTINLYHAIQYMVFVWSMEKENLQRRFNSSKMLAFMILILLAAIYGLVMAKNFNIVLSKVALGVVLLHYLFDSIVWKRK